MRIEQEELLKRIDSHEKWLINESDGIKFDTSTINPGGLVEIDGVIVSDRNLMKACFQGELICEHCVFIHVNFDKAVFNHCGFHASVFIDCTFDEAVFDASRFSHCEILCGTMVEASFVDMHFIQTLIRGTDLSYAKFKGIRGRVDTRFDVFRDVDFKGVEIGPKDLNIIASPVCPESGSFIGWKKANNMILKLLIPEDARRSSAFGRKCRCDKAVCLEIQQPTGEPANLNEITSDYDPNFYYRVGELVSVDYFDEDRTHECAPGIHFFITRQEAVEYI